MGFFSDMWNQIKGQAKTVGLDKVTEMGESVLSKTGDAIEKGANRAKDKLPDGLDKYVDQAAAKGKEVVEEATHKIEGAAASTVGEVLPTDKPAEETPKAA